jgi:hypothetical protein
MHVDQITHKKRAKLFLIFQLITLEAQTFMVTESFQHARLECKP